MKCRGYRFGVGWIAENDDPTARDLEYVDGTLTVLLLADLFDKDSTDVAIDVLRYRAKVGLIPPYAAPRKARKRHVVSHLDRRTQ